jgi:hypothetical protein
MRLEEQVPSTRIALFEREGQAERIPPMSSADNQQSSADIYQQRAVECYSLAEDFSDPRRREAMRQLAICWLHLSEHANESRQRETGHVRSAA